MTQREVSAEKMLKLGQLQERAGSSIFSRYLSSPDTVSTRYFLQICYAQRENLRRQMNKGKPIMNPDEFADTTMGPEARLFARSVLANIEQAAVSIGCEVCGLSGHVIDNLEGKEFTPMENSIVIGLVKDGRMSPVAITYDVLLVQRDDKSKAFRYDESTDFTALFSGLRFM